MIPPPTVVVRSSHRSRHVHAPASARRARSRALAVRRASAARCRAGTRAQLAPGAATSSPARLGRVRRSASRARSPPARRRARSAMPRQADETDAALAAATPAISAVAGCRSPACSVSISITAPITNAAMPPMPRTPKLGRNASATMKRDAQQDQREPGIVHRQQLQRVEPEQQADRADHAGHDQPGLQNSKISAVDADHHQDAARCSGSVITASSLVRQSGS